MDLAGRVDILPAMPVHTSRSKAVVIVQRIIAVPLVLFSALSVLVLGIIALAFIVATIWVLGDYFYSEWVVPTYQLLAH